MECPRREGFICWERGQVSDEPGSLPNASDYLSHTAFAARGGLIRVCSRARIFRRGMRNIAPMPNGLGKKSFIHRHACTSNIGDYSAPTVYNTSTSGGALKLLSLDQKR